MASNLSISTQIKKKRPLILFGFISLIVLLIGIYSGYIFGFVMKTNASQNSPSSMYGVYNPEIIEK